MSTKAWLAGIIIITILVNIVTFPGYDLVFLGAPLWIWLNIAAALVVFAMNASRARRWAEEEEIG